MTNLSIFYVVFISQMLLLTVYYPVKLLTRMRHIQRNYPKSSHPKLYPKSVNYYQNIATAYAFFNGLVLVLGCVIVYFIYEGSLVGEDGIHPMLPWGYFMLQMAPTWVIHIFGFKTHKLMKQKDTRTQKSATLKPRGLFQYVSPMLVGAVVVAYIAFVTFAFYLEGFKFEVGSKAFIMSAVLLVGYLFFLVVSVAAIYGKKSDPYQTNKDRDKAISYAIKVNCFTLIACALFMAFAAAVASFDLKSIMPIAMSLFLQFIVIISMGYVLQNCRVEDVNFDVYKAEPSAK